MTKPFGEDRRCGPRLPSEPADPDAEECTEHVECTSLSKALDRHRQRIALGIVTELDRAHVLRLARLVDARHGLNVDPRVAQSARRHRERVSNITKRAGQIAIT